MTRDEIEKKIFEVLEQEFELEKPGLDDNLREEYNFDSIDALELLEFIEDLISDPLTQDEKKEAMDIRTIRNICDYVEKLIKNRST